jgi:hypothetical protein
MNAAKPKGIPLATLLEGKDNERNLKAMMGETRGDARLRVALTDELLKSRDEARQRLAPLRKGRPKGAKNSDAHSVEQDFDRLYRANPDCSAEEVRQHKAPKKYRALSKSAFAEHWKKAKKRAAAPS